MKKTLIAFAIICLVPFICYSQLLVSKPVGKDAKNYGTGFGMFAFIDFPLAVGNQAFRVELLEISYYPAKNQGFFTGTDGKGYMSVKLGYKYVFSETQSGFYLLPSAGYGYIGVVTANEQNNTDHHGAAAAMETGYSFGIGEKGHAINVGVKYDYGIGNKGVSMQSVGLRFSYSFSFFGRSEY